MAKVVRSARRVAIAEFEENGPRVEITTTKPYQKARLSAGLTRRNEKQLVERLAANLASAAQIEADRAVFLASLATEVRPAKQRNGKKFRRPSRNGVVTVKASAAETRRIAQARRLQPVIVEGLAGLDLDSLDLSRLA